MILMALVTCMYGGCSRCARPCVILVPVDRHMGEMSSSIGLSGVDLDGGKAEGLSGVDLDGGKAELLEVAACMPFDIKLPMLQHSCTNLGT